MVNFHPSSNRMVSRTVWALTIHAITLATANIINCLNFIFMVN